MSDQPERLLDPEQERARQLAERVSEHAEAGDLTKARQALSRSWRELVPDLPERFAVLLKRLDRDAVREVLVRQRERGGRVRLRLIEKDDRLAVATSHGKTLILGLLPKADTRLLEEFGAEGRRYRPQLLEVNREPDGEIRSVAVELVRPTPRSEDGPDEGTSLALQEAIETAAEADEITDPLAE